MAIGNANTVTPEFLRGTAAVARFLGVHERTVSRWVKSHFLPYTKLGTALLFRVSELEELLRRFSFPSVMSETDKRGRGRRQAAARSKEGGAA